MVCLPVAPIEDRTSHIERRQSTYGVIVVIAISLLAAALTAQGWRSRIPAFDLVPDIHAVHALLATGALPEHGDVGSYGSFAPPGPAWLMLPSTLLFDDPRLSEYVGAGLLHFLSLLGIFLLGRKYFGPWCGCLAVVLYGLSAQGLWWAGSLWAIGSPDMFCWLVYLASEWVTRRDGRFFAAAVAAWAFGMYVDLSLAPAIAVLPAIWLVYRPPIKLKPLLGAAAVVLIVWFPYLRFEAGRDFADLRSQFLLHYILPSNVSQSWCDPGRELKALPANATTTAAPTQPAGATERAVSDAARPIESPFAELEDAFRDRLLGNFSSVTELPGQRVIGIILLSSVLASFILLSVTGSAQKNEFRTKRRRLPRVAVSVVVLALVTAFFLRLFGFDAGLPRPVRSAMAVLVLGGLALVLLNFATGIVDRLLKRAGVQLQSDEQLRRRRLVVLAVAIPWLLLLTVAEPGISSRFLWLWPLQVLVLASFFAVLLPGLGVPRSAAWLVQALLVFVFLWNSFLVSRIDAWHADGWSGDDAPEVRVVDYIAADLDTEGRDRAAIGYQLFIYPFMANYNIVSSYYKVGAEFDVLFQHRHGVENADTCAEGVSPRDVYRIVQTRPIEEQEAPRHYFETPLDNRFELVREVGAYQIFKATQERG
jgi:hypothetical protein